MILIDRASSVLVDFHCNLFSLTFCYGITFMHKILLVDDVKLLLEIQKKYLASSDVQILTAGDGAEALDVVRRERPDLVVMDRYMPKMDGVTCCAAIKGDPGLKHIPVIMVSNSSCASDLEEYNRAGCSDYLAKPVDGKVFLEMIKKYLPSIERRSFRVPLQTEVKLTFRGAVHLGRSEDIALGGLYVVTGVQLSMGDEVAISFLLPGNDSPMEARGRVAWVNRSGSGREPANKPGIGIEFIEITGQGIPFLRKGELKAYIHANIGKVVRGLGKC
jgi:uncharacterized protein (TIGR02266 family)